MKFLVLFAAFALAVSAVSDKDQWLQFKQSHGKQYRSLIEEKKRFSIFQQNLRAIETHNQLYYRGEKSYYYGVTQFADLTKAEFLDMLNTTGPAHNLPVKSLDHIEAAAVPDAIDWRDSGVVSEVKNQGSCGSCWSFSATGALEAAYTIKTGNHISLSEQNLIDCSVSYGNNGCSGGTIHAAFQYVVENGIETEEDYAYRAVDGTCTFDPALVAVKAQDYVALPYDNEGDLQKAVGTIGPVSVSVDANEYQFYAGGIMDDDSCTWTVNHGVLVVGYGSENGADFWIVKNSWGENWGDHGYLKMARNKNDQCGIALWGVYPIL